MVFKKRRVSLYHINIPKTEYHFSTISNSRSQGYTRGVNISLDYSSVHGTQRWLCSSRMLAVIVRITLNNLDSRASWVERFGCVVIQTNQLSVRRPSQFIRTLSVLQTLQECSSTVLYKLASGMREYFTETWKIFSKHFLSKKKTFFTHTHTHIRTDCLLVSDIVYRKLVPTFRKSTLLTQFFLQVTLTSTLTKFRHTEDGDSMFILNTVTWAKPASKC
jgi:hypothetical protein